MSSTRAVALLASAISLFAVASASAATTIGQVPGESVTPTDCSGPFTVWQNTTSGAAAGAASGGVITSVRTFQPATAAGRHFKLAVVSLDNTSFSPAGQMTVQGKTEEFTVAGAGAVEQFAARIPIATGQGIAMLSTDGVACHFDTTDDGDTILFNADGDPAAGTAMNPGDGDMASRVNLEATIEPDADGDGYGDETQDTCPSDPGTHDGACSADTSVSATVTPSTIGIGDVAVLSGTAGNAGNATAADAIVHFTAAAGLEVVGSIPSAGCAFATDLACPLGALAKGASAPFILVVRATSTGTKALGASVSSSVADPNPANNTAAAQVVVEQQVPLACNVPKLKGLTKGQAKRLLEALNCERGKVKRKRFKKGRRGTVRRQSEKAGSSLPAGSKVDITLKKRGSR